MKTYNYLIPEGDFSTLFDQAYKETTAKASVLIQVFSGEPKERFEEILHFLAMKFPKATIVATSTDGEIFEGNVTTRHTVVSITAFEATRCRIAYEGERSSFQKGANLAKKLVSDQTKLLIAFADGLVDNGEEFLNGIASVAPHIKVAGGLAGDNSEFKVCHVGIRDKLYDKGAVAVALDSQKLQVESFYNFGWHKVGKKHIITHSEKNRVYTIDGITAIDFYKKYLGEQIARDLPATGIEFPLIMTKNGVDIARATTNRYDDGSLAFAGNLAEKEEVYLGVGDMEEIVSDPLQIEKINAESFFIYSCMARRRFLPDLIEEELAVFARIAPTSGFFTYGEFYTGQKPELLNQTLTAVALSESNKEVEVAQTPKEIKSGAERSKEALIHLLSVTTKELYEDTLKLQKMEKELQAKQSTLKLIQELAHIGMWEFDVNTEKIRWSDEIFRIHKREISKGAPSFKEFMLMVAEEDRVKLLEAKEKLIDGRIHSAEIRARAEDGTMLTLIISAKMIFENDEPKKIVGTILDITELKLKDNIISQQAKLAQMGEMINMIAHQWRQPLNAINAAAIKLNMQNELGLVTPEKIEETTRFIESVAQEMSDIINDFMNFTSPTNNRENVEIEGLVDDILRLMGAQLKGHDIRVVKKIQKGLSCHIYKKELEHVLINLLANAKDALDTTSRDDKKIIIEAYEENGKYIIEVSDNAGGIKSDIIDRIFEPYFTTKEEGKGTGLGLYMSKKIIKENLHGDLKVQNSQDGVKFTIVLRCEK